MSRPTQRNRGERGRVLAIHRYFWPDSPPYASMLRAIVGRWVRDGATVEVLGTQPSYKSETVIPRQPRQERIDGVQVTRVRLPRERGSTLRKLLNIPLFTAAAARRVLRLTRGDVVMCSTSPPVLLSSGVSLVARLRGVKFIYHCMDIHPEIGSISGDFSNPHVFRVLRALDRATCRRAHHIIVLSSDMRQALLARDPGLVKKIIVLNNFDLPQFAEEDGYQVAKGLGIPPRKAALRLVFTGNVGRFQGLDEVVSAVLSSNADVELVVMGDGTIKELLQRHCNGHPQGARVTFLPPGTPSEARRLMRSADAGVVSLAPGIVRYAYPSKTMTYLTEGLPLLVVAEADSELSRNVQAQQVGVTVEPGDDIAMEQALKALAIMATDGSSEMRERARYFAARTFSSEGVLNQWVEILRNVQKDG